MLTPSQFEEKIYQAIQNNGDLEVIERYNAKDPIVLQQIQSVASFLSLLSQEIDVATLEPFIKTRDRSIIADATNKGLKPYATPCQYMLEIKNNGINTVNLSGGRLIEDNSGGRVWRLNSSVSIEPNATKRVIVEQSEKRTVELVANDSAFFKQFTIPITDGMYLADLVIKQGDEIFKNSVRWYNVNKGEKAVNVTTDDLRNFVVQFGDDDKVGVTAKGTYTAELTETYGYIDVSRLKDASLYEIYNNDETRLNLKFVAPSDTVIANVIDSKTGKNREITEREMCNTGSDPLSVAQMRILSSYPSLYDENAVFLGNFEYLVRRKFMDKTKFISVWNEATHERYGGTVDKKHINHLNVAFVPKNKDETNNLKNEIGDLIQRVDDLYRVNFYLEKDNGGEDGLYLTNVDVKVEIVGTISSVHDDVLVSQQIKQLLTKYYGEDGDITSRWLPNGFNVQEMQSLIRKNVPAFQDQMSDFTIKLTYQTQVTQPDGSKKAVSQAIMKPYERIYINQANIDTSKLRRTAEMTGATWIL